MTELELYAALGHAVARLHERLPERAGEPVMCTCGSPVVLCPYQGLMRRIGLPRTAEGSAR